MIIIVHSLYFVIRYALRWYRRYQANAIIRLSAEQRALESLAAEKPAALPLDPEECFVFPIPVYRQRYSAVQDVLLDPRWRKDIRKVVDFGCAEFGFFQYLKHLMGVTDILEVDIDDTLLKENMFRVQPLTADYLKQRTDPLTVEIFRGSISDPDWRIRGIDAVVGIEIIEHLFPDILDALPYNIFGFVQPKLAIFTTPNADFNVLFPNFKGFRHDDHKFEWTRQQFEDWAQNIVLRYPNYSVTFTGIGKGPKGTESLGCCSQMAVFVKEYEQIHSEVAGVAGHASNVDVNHDWRSFGVCTHFSFSQAQMALLADDLFDLNPRLIKEGNITTGEQRQDEYFHQIGVIKYPFVEDVRSPEEKVLYEAMQQIYMHASHTSRYFNEDTGIVEIPLYEVVKNFDGHFVSESEIRVILEGADFKIGECTLYGSDERCLCVLYDIEMAGQSSRTASDYEPSEHAEEVEVNDDARCTVDKLANLARNINSSADSDWEFDERAMRAGHASKDEAATPSDPLVDSGYQKSLSNAEWSPQSPIDGHFDEQFMPKMDVNDIKDSIKARLAKTHNGMPMNNRLLSEWRRFSGGCSRSAVKYTPTTAPPSLGGAARTKSPTPGTSRRRKSFRSDSEEDAKSIADVLLYNSLNKIEIDVPHVEQPVVPLVRPQDLEIPQFIVENGDLANNNRDGEGNNIPEVDDVLPNLEFANGDDPNENVDHIDYMDNEDEENRNVVNNHNPDDGIVVDAPPEVQVIPVLEIVDVHHALPPPPLDEEDEEELNHASREALFDPNSQSDFLEDGSITDEAVDPAEFDVEPAADSVAPVNNLFPHWLLQLLGGANNTADADGEDAQWRDSDEDEPHFYCQGDGLGVHPSVVDVDRESSSIASSTDEAVAERTLSENDLRSLPTDGVSIATDSAAAALAIFGRALDIPLVMLDQTASNMSQDSGGEEFFDTLAEPNANSAHRDASSSQG